MYLKFLGTTDSAGIPVHNCQCVACQEYRNAGEFNSATHAVIECDDGVILLDAGAEDLANQYDGTTIKAIFLTHFHADHALGLLRLRHSYDAIDCYHPQDELGFSDLFKHKHRIIYHENTPLQPVTIDGIRFTPIPLIHSKNTQGYLIETSHCKVAYLTDCAGIKAQYLDYLRQIRLDYLFIDACFAPPKRGNHLNYHQAAQIIEQLDVQEGYFLHLSHECRQYQIESGDTPRYNYIHKGFCIKL